MLERVEQRLSDSRYSCSTGADGAAASLEHREQLCWSMWSSGSLRADTVAPLEHTEQHLSGSRFNSSTAAYVPAELLCVLLESSCSRKYLYLLPESHCSTFYNTAALCAPGTLLLHVLHWSTCICSQRAAAPRAPAKLLFVIQGCRCSMCYNGAAVSAPREPLLHVLQWSTCICSQRAAAPRQSTCSSKAALCAPGKQLLHVLQWSTCICSQRAASPRAPAELLSVLRGSSCSMHVLLCSRCRCSLNDLLCCMCS